MNQVAPLVVAIILIFAVVAVALWYKSTHVKEGYENAYIDNNMLSHVYQKSGIERCETLYADAAVKADVRDNMSGKALESMDDYVLGHRLREWQPSDKGLTKQNKKYCYMMFDSNNNAIDPLLESATCDARNPVFQGLPFLDRVFVDSTADVTHTLPYTKCVLEVSPAKVDATSLDKFWSRTGQQQCELYKGKTENKIKDLGKTLSSLSNEFHSFSNLEPKYINCMNDQRGLLYTLSNASRMYALSNCAFSGECDDTTTEKGSAMTMKEEYEMLLAELQSLQSSVSGIDSDIVNSQKMSRQDQRKLNEMNISYSSLSNAFIRCSNVDFPEKSKQYQELSDELGRLYNTSNMAKKQLENCRIEGAKAKKEYEQIVTDVTNAQAKYTESNALLINCLSTNDYLRQTIATLKDQTQKVATQCNECMAAVITNTALASSLNKDVVRLRRERDYWLKKCTYDQKKMLDLSIKTIDKLRKASSQYTRTNCGNDMVEAQQVNDLIQQKFEALAALNTPPYCDDNKRGECCKALGFE